MIKKIGHRSHVPGSSKNRRNITRGGISWMDRWVNRMTKKYIENNRTP